MAAVREKLRHLSLEHVSNPGLALDRYVPVIAGDSPERRVALRDICAAGVGDLYAKAYDYRCQRITAMGAVTAEYRTAGRLIVGLGGESVHETGIALLRPYGVPYIPGSALKGLARRYAGKELTARADRPGLDSDQLKALFGEQDYAGYLTWFDAWYVPGSAPSNRPLALDTITVHHPSYYSSAGEGPGAIWTRTPTDFDDPTPVTFLSARGAWLVAVCGPTPEWTTTALGVLDRAISAWGIGAKTSSGYGRLTGPALPDAGAATVAAMTATVIAPATPPLVGRIQALTVKNVKQEISNLWGQSAGLAPSDRRQVAQAIQAKAGELKEQKWLRGRSWYDELQACLDLA